VQEKTVAYPLLSNELVECRMAQSSNGVRKGLHEPIDPRRMLHEVAHRGSEERGIAVGWVKVRSLHSFIAPSQRVGHDYVWIKMLGTPQCTFTQSRELPFVRAENAQLIIITSPLSLKSSNRFNKAEMRSLIKPCRRRTLAVLK
jgi:hypothetical protein